MAPSNFGLEQASTAEVVQAYQTKLLRDPDIPLDELEQYVRACGPPTETDPETALAAGSLYLAAARAWSKADAFPVQAALMPEEYVELRLEQAAAYLGKAILDPNIQTPQRLWAELVREAMPFYKLMFEDQRSYLASRAEPQARSAFLQTVERYFKTLQTSGNELVEYVKRTGDRHSQMLARILIMATLNDPRLNKKRHAFYALPAPSGNYRGRFGGPDADFLLWHIQPREDAPDVYKDTVIDGYISPKAPLGAIRIWGDLSDQFGNVVLAQLHGQLHNSETPETPRKPDEIDPLLYYQTLSPDTHPTTIRHELERIIEASEDFYRRNPSPKLALTLGWQHLDRGNTTEHLIRAYNMFIAAASTNDQDTLPIPQRLQAQFAAAYAAFLINGSETHTIDYRPKYCAELITIAQLVQKALRQSPTETEQYAQLTLLRQQLYVCWVIASSPMPAFVAGPATPRQQVGRHLGADIVVVPQKDTANRVGIFYEPLQYGRLNIQGQDSDANSLRNDHGIIAIPHDITHKSGDMLAQLVQNSYDHLPKRLENTLRRARRVLTSLAALAMTE